MCGIVMVSEGNGGEGVEGKDVEIAAQGVTEVVKQVKERLQAQYDVMKQLHELGTVCMAKITDTSTLMKVLAPRYEMGTRGWLPCKMI